jgi:FkbM family methyltransferase
MIKRILNKLRRTFQPSIQDRWRADHGDTKLRLEYPLSPDSLVMDLGGYEGQWTSDIYSRYGCRVAIFEPVASFAENIRKRFEGNPSIEVFQYGLGSTKRKEQIHLSSDGSSIFNKEGQMETITIHDAIEWFEKRGNPKVALAKINIEGGEYELLERLAQGGIIPYIENLQIQFHPIASDSRDRMSAIQAILSLTHDLKWQYDFVWESWSIKEN